MRDSWGADDFSVASIIERSRGGSFPSGYLESFLERQQRVHAVLHSRICDAIDALKEAGRDPDIRF